MQRANIGERIKERRTELDISASELADRLHMSRATIFRYESGEIKTIKVPVIVSIAKELKVNPAWLLGKSERKEPVADSAKTSVEITEVLEELIAMVEHREDMECYGVRMGEEDRASMATLLRVMLQLAETRYRK